MAGVPGFLHHLFLLEEAAENEVAVQNWRITRKRLRDMLDPFDLPVAVFKQNFRLNKDLTRDLIEKVSPFLTGHRAFSLTVTQKVLISLQFLACGSYQRGSVSQHNLLNVSQASVSHSLKAFLMAMDVLVVPDVIRFPETENDIQEKKLGFYTKFGIPGVIGAVDGTLIAIIRPVLNEEQYYNRKGYHCINVQLICDSNLRILNVNPRNGGATHDAYVWRHSVINQHLKTAHLHGQTYTWLVADSGYPILPWVLLPIPEAANTDTPEGRYTHAHVRARNTVERVNGVLKNKWRCLLKHRTLHYTPEKARQIIRSCAALHNIALNMPDYVEYAENFVPEEAPDPDNEPAVPSDNALFLEGQRVRRDVIADHFT